MTMLEGYRERHGGRVVVGGVTYAAGLFWEPADDPQMVLREAKSVARTEGVDADIFCVRPGAPPQYGLGWKNIGHGAGQRPLAAAVCEASGGSYIGAFEVDGRWWFGAAAGDVILPDGDALYDNEEACRQHFERHYAEMHEDIVVFAPTGWGVQNGRQADLEVLIARPPSIRLKPVDSLLVRYRVLLVLLVLLGVVIFMGLRWWNEQRMEARRIGVERIQAARDTIRKAGPWLVRPDAITALDQCYGLFQQVPIGVFGWSLVQAECKIPPPLPGADPLNPPLASARMDSIWARDRSGLLLAMREAVKGNDLSLMFGENGDSAQAGLYLPQVIPAFGAERTPADPVELWSEDNVKMHLWGTGQKLGVAFNVGELQMQPRPSTIGSDGRELTLPDGRMLRNQLPPMPAWLRFEVESGITIPEWRETFKRIPGATIDQVVWNARNGQWRLLGQVYVYQE